MNLPPAHVNLPAQVRNGLRRTAVIWQAKVPGAICEAVRSFYWHPYSSFLRGVGEKWYISDSYQGKEMLAAS
jgi:hypothetical protein